MAYTKKYFEVKREQSQLALEIWHAVEKVAPNLTMEQIQYVLLEQVYHTMGKGIFSDKTLINDK